MAARWSAYAGADVFVFPSLTDTFGLVLLEALACGTPVAAFPATGPIDVLADARDKIGSVNVDLRVAALDALDADRGGLSRARRTLLVARLRRSVPVASGADGRSVLSGRRSKCGTGSAAIFLTGASWV